MNTIELQIQSIVGQLNNGYVLSGILPKVTTKGQFAERYQKHGNVFEANVSGLLYCGVLYMHNEFVITQVVIDSHMKDNFHLTLKLLRQLEDTLEALSKAEGESDHAVLGNRFTPTNIKHAEKEVSKYIRENCYGVNVDKHQVVGAFVKGITSVYLELDRVRHRLFVTTNKTDYEIDVLTAADNIKGFIVGSGFNCADEYWEGVSITKA